MLYDTYSSLYNTYTVLDSKITVDFWSEEAAHTYAQIVGIKLDDDTTLTPLLTSTIIEQPSSLVRYKWLRGSTTDIGRPTRLRHYYSAKKFHGVKDVVDNPDMSADIGANPIKTASFILFTCHPSDSTDLPVIRYSATIEYIVKFDELRDISSS